MNWRPVWIALLVLCLSAPALPQTLVEEAAEERALRAIAERLRCPVCQGENLYDSRSELAVEMRAIIRERLAAGDSDHEIVEYFVARYGDYVRLEPARTGGQLLIWFLPVLVGVPGLALVIRILRRRRPRAVSSVAGDPALLLRESGGPES